MDSLGIAHCGVYRNANDRKMRYPLIIDKKDVRIAILNYTYGTNGRAIPEPMIVNLIDKETIKRDIADAKCLNPDVIIACMHWGDEYVSLPPQRIKELADWLLEQGVDHIIGNHPHVLQPMEMRSDTLSIKRHAVVYSLGNLVSGMFARGRDGGAMVTLKMQKFCGTTRLMQMKYLLTWVARPGRDKVKNFEIWPISNHPQDIPAVTKEKMTEFINDSRELLKNTGDYIKEEI